MKLKINKQANKKQIRQHGKQHKLPQNQTQQRNQSNEEHHHCPKYRLIVTNHSSGLYSQYNEQLK